MNKFLYRMLGGISILLGISIPFNPVTYDPILDYTFDATETKWPLGGGLIVLGILFIWSTFRKKNIEFEKKTIDEKSVLMCPKCVKPFYKKDAPALKCPDCQNPLENLSGFYERHPELKGTTRSRIKNNRTDKRS